MLLDIVEEHLDEAVWLFDRRQAALRSQVTTDKEIGEVEERLRAHLNGFVLGGEAGWELCRSFLTRGKAGKAFVAAIAALEGGDPARLEELNAALATTADETYEGIRWACRFTDWPGVVAFLLPQLDRPEPTPRAVAIDALTARGLDPSPALDEALSASPGPLLIAAIVGAGRLGLTRVTKAVEALTASEDPEVCGAALESLAALDPERARLRCKEILRAGAPADGAAANVLKMIGTTDDDQQD